VMDAVTQQVIVQYQQANHQPVDGSRTYAETSLHWVFWYVGIPVVILATAGAAVLARHCLRGRAPLWTLPLMTFAWTIVTFLYQPAITPDQPWASRRLVPAVLPGFILLAVWASARLVGGLGEHEYPAVLRRGSAVVLAAALVLPAAITTFGLSVTTGGPVGLRLNADGVAFKTTYAGELSAIDGVCASIPEGSSVIFIDGPLADRVAETIRGMCDVPVARLTVPGHPPASIPTRGYSRFHTA